MSEKTVVDVVDYLPLVRAQALRYVPSWHVDFDDLVQAGCVGLLRAARRFDPTRGSFGNFAAWFVMHEQMRFLERRPPTMERLDSLDFDDEGAADPSAVNAEATLTSSAFAVRELAAAHADKRMARLVECFTAHDSGPAAARAAKLSYAHARRLLANLGGRRICEHKFTRTPTGEEVPR